MDHVSSSNTIIAQLRRYFDSAQETFKHSSPNPVEDFETQMQVARLDLLPLTVSLRRAKLAVGLLSGDYSQTPEVTPGQEDKVGLPNLYRSIR